MNALQSGFFASHTPSTPFFSLEFSPPKTAQGEKNLENRLERIALWKPLFGSVTFRIPGTTITQSIDFASKIKRDYGIEPLLHLTCVNMTLGKINCALRRAKEKGIINILALKGDYPDSEALASAGLTETNLVKPEFTFASQLVEYIKTNPEFKDVFNVGVVGHPEGYFRKDSTDLKVCSIDQIYNNKNISDGIDLQEIRFLKTKVDKGANFVISQAFYSSDKFLNWYNTCRVYGISVPIIPSFFPIQTYKSFELVTKLNSLYVPQDLLDKVKPATNDKIKLEEMGVDLAVKQISEIRESTDVIGFHISTLNLEKNVKKILEGTGFIQNENIPF
ncbi:hypothetical protein BB561_001286 [Smittium simulii]|uniref:Methylenetetrahydrofolate reductase (NAD(P)H) n=1 Tax=Smittium simulii TaxID=133385 RepID=A0A2T9YVF3_9FUNG|nr:hypothetical protein BB561_001286 [Smittium simulii]